MGPLKNQKTPSKPHLALLVFLGLLTLTVMLWNRSEDIRNQEIEDSTESVANSFKLHFDQVLEKHFLAVEQIESFWLVQGAQVEREAFAKLAQRVLDQSPALRMVGFLMEGREELWLEHRGREDAEAFKKNLFSNKSVLKERSNAYEAQEMRVSMVEDFYYGKGFVLWVPTWVGSTFQGWVVVAYELELLFKDFTKLGQIDHYGFIISENYNPIYARISRDASADPLLYRPFKMTRPIPLKHRHWTLMVWPERQFLGTYPQFFNYLILVMGFCFSLSTSLFIGSLQSRAKRLEVAVAQRTEELKRKNDELASKNEEIENFVYTMSHDLKAPIVSIQGFASILKGEFAGKLPAEAAHYLSRIEANTNEMHLLVKDLLELSRIGRVEEHAEEVDMQLIIEDLLSEFKPSLEEKHISVKIHNHFPKIHGVPRRIHQVFANLVSNAIKYIGSPEHPEIEIGCLELGIVEDENGLWTFYVKDNGMGIPKEYHDRIFMIFQRVNPDPSIEGTGVGLCIVKKIVEKHGGTIRLESEVGRGSTFYVSFPLERVAGVQKHEVGAEVSNPSR